MSAGASENFTYPTKRYCFVYWAHQTWIVLCLFLWWWVVLWRCKLHFSIKINVNIKFLHPNGPAAQFLRPSLEDTCWIPIHDIIAKADPSSSGSTGRLYCFYHDETNRVKNLMWFNWHLFPAASFKQNSKHENANKYTLSDSNT